MSQATIPPPPPQKKKNKNKTKNTITTQKRYETSITKRFRTDVRRSIEVTTDIKLVLLINKCDLKVIERELLATFKSHLR